MAALQEKGLRLPAIRRFLGTGSAGVWTCSLLLLSLLQATGMAQDRPGRTPKRLEIASWGYQLQDLDLAAVAATKCDLLVLDYLYQGRPFRPSELASIREGRQKRLILSYLSIGEAEDYRYYWSERWRSAPPGWLGQENSEWPGNYAVKFWDPEWQRIFLRASGYVDRIVWAGFDGVYLDRTDAFEFWTERPGADREMASFVGAIAARGRSLKPDFLVFAQNGEKLVASADYRALLDGIAKEDLYFGAQSHGHANSAAETARSLSYLRQASATGLPVLLVEYLKEPEAIGYVRTEAAKEGFPLVIAGRALAKTPLCK